MKETDPEKTDLFENLIFKMCDKMEETNATTIKATFHNCKTFRGRDLTIVLSLPKKRKSK